MGLIRVYSLETNIHSNACETDNPDDIGKWLIAGLKEWPLRTIINIRIHDLPQDLWAGMPQFEGFKYGNSSVETPGSD